MSLTSCAAAAFFDGAAAVFFDGAAAAFLGFFFFAGGARAPVSLWVRFATLTTSVGLFAVLILIAPQADMLQCTQRESLKLQLYNWKECDTHGFFHRILGPSGVNLFRLN
jgi:hypothetical protein